MKADQIRRDIVKIAKARQAKGHPKKLITVPASLIRPAPKPAPLLPATPLDPNMTTVKFKLSTTERQIIKSIAARNGITLDRAYRLAVCFSCAINFDYDNNRFEFESYIQKMKGGD